MNISLYAFAPENLISREGFGSHVPRQPAHLHTPAESGAYSIAPGRNHSRSSNLRGDDILLLKAENVRPYEQLLTIDRA